MIRLLLRGYPAAWRARYGDEFVAMLEERPLGPFDVADVLLGALDAQLHLRGLGAASAHRKGFFMSLRIGGYAAILGGLLWIVGLGVNAADGTDDFWPSMVFVLVGSAAILVALVGLSAFQARAHPRLAWAAFAVPFVGSLLVLVGLVAIIVAGDRTFVAGLSGWDFWIVGLLLLVAGSGLFALASWRTGGVSRAGTAMLGASALLLVPLVPLFAGVFDIPWEPIISIVFLGEIIAFAGGWVLMGLGAVRADRPTLASAGGAL